MWLQSSEVLCLGRWLMVEGRHSRLRMVLSWAKGRSFKWKMEGGRALILGHLYTIKFWRDWQPPTPSGRLPS